MRGVGLLLGMAQAAAAAAGRRYVKNFSYVSEDFFSHWHLDTIKDPTHGFVTYVDYDTALREGLVNATANRVFMGADRKTVSTDKGRKSVRIVSKAGYNRGLFIVSMDHMPTGCGMWPALWMLGMNKDLVVWPTWGEYDIIEGVHRTTRAFTSLHTLRGCDQSSLVPGKDFGSTWCQGATKEADNCDINAPGQWPNQGCSQVAPPASMGPEFNDNRGGTYAAEWDPEAGYLRAWFWPAGTEPSDVPAGSPDPESWGIPYSNFVFSPDKCPRDKVQNMHIIYDLTFCGDLAGVMYRPMCPQLASKMTCEELVGTNLEEMKEAYWSIRTLDVYQREVGKPGKAEESQAQRPAKKAEEPKKAPSAGAADGPQEAPQKPPRGEAQKPAKKAEEPRKPPSTGAADGPQEAPQKPPHGEAQKPAQAAPSRKAPSTDGPQEVPQEPPHGEAQKPVQAAPSRTAPSAGAAERPQEAPQEPPRAEAQKPAQAAPSRTAPSAGAAVRPQEAPQEPPHAEAQRPAQAAQSRKAPGTSAADATQEVLLKPPRGEAQKPLKATEPPSSGAVDGPREALLQPPRGEAQQPVQAAQPREAPSSGAADRAPAAPQKPPLLEGQQPAKAAQPREAPSGGAAAGLPQEVLRKPLRGEAQKPAKAEEPRRPLRGEAERPAGAKEEEGEAWRAEEIDTLPAELLREPRRPESSRPEDLVAEGREARSPQTAEEVVLKKFAASSAYPALADRSRLSLSTLACIAAAACALVVTANWVWRSRTRSARMASWSAAPAEYDLLSSPAPLRTMEPLSA